MVIDGYGDGYGYGYGYGYGSGEGYGYGDGSGEGYGYGDGSGAGKGYGYGDGSGAGDGYGYGYGYGYGSGDGYMDALLKAHKGENMVVAFWRSRADGSPANGGSGNPRKVGQIEQVDGPLEICSSRALHGTMDPKQWRGQRLWVVGLHEPVVRKDDKVASLKRTILDDLGIWFND